MHLTLDHPLARLQSSWFVELCIQNYLQQRGGDTSKLFKRAPKKPEVSKAAQLKNADCAFQSHVLVCHSTHKLVIKIGIDTREAEQRGGRRRRGCRAGQRCGNCLGCKGYQMSLVIYPLRMGQVRIWEVAGTCKS